MGEKYREVRGNAFGFLAAVLSTDTSHNGDNKKRRHTKTATIKTATTVVKTATVHKSKRRQLLVKTATVIGQNGDSHWSKRF